MNKSVNIKYFSSTDYTVFAMTLFISTSIGVYFGFIRKKQNTPTEYLHGGKKMRVLPIAASLVAGDISGVSLLGIPVEVYTNGFVFILRVFSFLFAMMVNLYIFVPVFYKLQVTSNFQYLQMRYSTKISMVATLIFVLNMTLIVSVMVYSSILAFSQVCGLSVEVITVTVCGVCIFYTVVGGMKAVVWTDTIQIVIMIVSTTIILILGFVKGGNLENIWKTASEGGRLNFKWSFDPTDNTASFTLSIGIAVISSAYHSGPVFAQRLLSLPTISDCKKALWVFTAGMIFFTVLPSLLGIVIYSRYANCDPLLAGLIKKSDQLTPYFTMDVGSSIPGLPGVFIAGLLSAALSTLSTAINTFAGVLYYNIIKMLVPGNISDERASNIIKATAVILGLLCTGLIIAVQHLGTVLQLTYSLSGLVLGPLLAMFVLGMLVPVINEKGIFYGSITSILLNSWMVFGNRYYKMKGVLKETSLAFSTSECHFNISTNATFSKSDESTYEPLYIYKISVYYYCLTGFLITSIMAVIISWFTGGRTQKIDKSLLNPIIHKYLKDSQTHFSEEELQELNKIPENSSSL